MRLTFIALAFAATFLTGCTKKTDAGSATGECASAADCPEGLQCIDAACVDVACTTSAECPFETYCDVQDYACIDGCKEDSDCLSGFDCDAVANVCVQNGCTDTQLDCEYGENCNADSQECVPDPRDHCGTCDALNGGNNQCQGGTCYFWGGDTCNSASDCDPGYSCDNVPGYGKICHADYCLVDCNPNQAEACPRGFDCVDASGAGDYVCYADCDYMTGNGYL